jgi:hypothetical protein
MTDSDFAVLMILSCLPLALKLVDVLLKRRG